MQVRLIRLRGGTSTRLPTPAKSQDTFKDGYRIIGKIVLYQSGREHYKLSGSVIHSQLKRSLLIHRAPMRFEMCRSLLGQTHTRLIHAPFLQTSWSNYEYRNEVTNLNTTLSDTEQVLFHSSESRRVLIESQRSILHQDDAGTCANHSSTHVRPWLS